MEAWQNSAEHHTPSPCFRDLADAHDQKHLPGQIGSGKHGTQAHGQTWSPLDLVVPWDSGKCIILKHEWSAHHEIHRQNHKNFGQSLGVRCIIDASGACKWQVYPTTSRNKSEFERPLMLRHPHIQNDTFIHFICIYIYIYIIYNICNAFLILSCSNASFSVVILIGIGCST